MNIGAIIIAIVIVRGFASWSKQGSQQAPNTGVSIIHQEVSFRFFLLTVLYVSLYGVLFFLIYSILDSVLPPIRIDRLRDFFLISVAAIAPLLIFRAAPPWLAWHVFRPFGLHFLARFCYWFTLGASKRELEGFSDLLRASKGYSPLSADDGQQSPTEKNLRPTFLKRKPIPLKIDDWTIAASALAAEVRGDSESSKRLLRSFELCPPGMGPSGNLRRFAFEELAWLAVARGEWEQAGYCAGLMTGRGRPILRILVSAALTGRGNRACLWFAWLISPKRMTALPFALAASKKRLLYESEVHVPDNLESDSEPRGMHMRLLYRAAEGVPLSMEEVFRLAFLWERELTFQNKEKLLLWGMELGARDVLGTAERIRENVLVEMTELALVADGYIPAMTVDDDEEGNGSFVDDLMIRLKNQLYEDVSHAEERFELPEEVQLSDGDLMGKWHAWLGMHETVSLFQRLLGDDEMSVLWYGGLETTAWNGAAQIYNSTPKRTAWISIVMFYWVAEICGRMGHVEGEATNRNNMKLCGYSEPFLRRLLSVINGYVRKVVEMGEQGIASVRKRLQRDR